MWFMQNAVEQPPKWFGRWVGAYTINVFIVVWVLIVGFGFGGWASMTNFIHQIDTFGLFTKCYQCLSPGVAPASRPSHGFNATTAGAAAPPLHHHPFNHTRRPWFAQLDRWTFHGVIRTLWSSFGTLSCRHRRHKLGVEWKYLTNQIGL